MSHRASQLLLIAIAFAVLLGGLSGWYLGEAMLVVAPLGTLFLNALKMLALPLIVAAVISGIGGLGDVRKLGKIGYITLLYFLFSTFAAVAIGLFVVNWIAPGEGIMLIPSEMPAILSGKTDISAGDILLSLVSPNLIASAANLDLLPIILFSIAFAAAATQVQSGQKLIAGVEVLNQAMMKLVVWVMYFAPVGIFAMVASKLGEAGGGASFGTVLIGLGKFIQTVLLGLLIHFLLLLVVLRVFARQGIPFLRKMSRALLTAFGTASSTATVPITMEAALDARLDERAVRFTIPLGSTVNMNGTALYEACAALYIAQIYGVELSLGQQVIVLLTSTLAAIGAAGIPEAGLVTMVIVLKAVGLPLEGIGQILAVNWFLDRFRTAVNVWGDAVGAAVVSRQIPAQVLPTQNAN